MPAPMTREERESFLAGIHVGILTVDEPGRGPLSVPVWYLYEPGGEIVVVTRPEARHGCSRSARARPFSRNPRSCRRSTSRSRDASCLRPRRTSRAT